MNSTLFHQINQSLNATTNRTGCYSLQSGIFTLLQV